MPQDDEDSNYCCICAAHLDEVGMCPNCDYPVLDAEDDGSDDDTCFLCGETLDEDGLCPICDKEGLDGNDE